MHVVLLGIDACFCSFLCIDEMSKSIPHCRNEQISLLEEKFEENQENKTLMI